VADPIERVSEGLVGRGRARPRGPWPALVLVGAALWVLYRLAEGPEAHTLVVSTDTVAALAAGFSQQHGREPTAAELEALVDAWVEEELLIREARAQGLDRADPIVRRRLAQKLRFVLEDLDAVDDPGDAVLAAWHHAHAEHYRRPPRRGFTHGFVAGLDGAAKARAQALARALEQGADPAGQGDAFPHGSHQGPVDHAALADRYGDELAQAVAAAPMGRWFAVRSRWGWHALRVDDERPAAIPPLSQIRARVLADWQVERRATNLAQGLTALRERYRVEVER
jgi:peptidyl-prolyl cis-trans isomerase C